MTSLVVPDLADRDRDQRFNDVRHPGLLCGRGDRAFSEDLRSRVSDQSGSWIPLPGVPWSPRVTRHPSMRPAAPRPGRGFPPTASLPVPCPPRRSTGSHRIARPDDITRRRQVEPPARDDGTPQPTRPGPANGELRRSESTQARTSRPCDRFRTQRVAPRRRPVKSPAPRLRPPDLEQHGHLRLHATLRDHPLAGDR